MSKRKNAGRIVCVLFALLFTVFAAGTAFSGVNVNINVGPPAVVVAGPPEMIVVPRTMVYFAPGVGVDLFFHAGYWWTPKEVRGAPGGKQEGKGEGTPKGEGKEGAPGGGPPAPRPGILGGGGRDFVRPEK